MFAFHHTYEKYFFPAAQEIKLSASFNNSSAPYCSTPGCHGVGNIKGPRYPNHNSLESCPYSPKNMGSELLIPDRIQGSLKRQEGVENENTNRHM